MFRQQYFGNSIGCKLTLSYSSQVLPYWKGIKRVLLQITWEVCVAVGKGKQISRLKLLVLCSNPSTLCMNEGCQKGPSSYRQRRLFDVLKKISSRKQDMEFTSAKIISGIFPLLLVSQFTFWHPVISAVYPKVSVVLVSCFKD